MAVGGERPETGVRILIERDAARPDPPWRYAGAAHLPQETFRVTVDVDAEGEVVVRVLDEGAPPDLPEKVRLIVRAVFRQAKADGQPPAWRIVRWRGDK